MHRPGAGPASGPDRQQDEKSVSGSLRFFSGGLSIHQKFGMVLFVSLVRQWFVVSLSHCVVSRISGASPPSHSSCSSSSLSAVAHLSNDFSLPFPPTACLLGEEKRELFLPSPSTEEEEDDDEEDEEDDDGLSCNSVDDPRSRDLSYFSPYSLPAEEGTEEEEGGSRRGGGQGGGREVFGEREEEECWTGEERGRDGQDGEGSSFSIGSIPREEYLKDVMDVSLFPASQAQLGEGFLPSWLQPKWLTGGRGGGGGGERQDAYQTSGSPSWLLSGLECIAYLPALVWQEKLLSSSSSSTSSSCSSCEEEKTSYEEGDRATAERDLSLEARQGWFSSLFKTWERRGGFFSRGGIASQGQQQGSSSASFSPDFPGSSSVLRSLQGEPEHRSCPWREEEEIRAGHQAMSARSFLSVVDVIPSMTLSQNPTLSLVTSKGDRVSLRLVASSLPASPSSLLADTQKLRRTQRRDPVREGEGRVDRCCGLPFCRQSNASLLAYRLEVLSVLPSPCTLSPSSSSLLLSRVLPFGCSPTKTESFEDRHASVENSRVFGGVSRGSYSARGLLSSAWHHRQTTDFSPSSLSPPPRSLLSRGVESRSRVDNQFSLPFFSFSPPAPCCHFYNNGLFLFSSQSPHLVSSAGGLADSLSDRSSTFISLRLSLPASSPSSFFLSSYLPLDLPSPPIAAAESSLLWPSQGSASSTFSSYPIEGLPPSLSLPAASSPFPAPFSSSSSSFPSCFSYSSPFSGFFPSSLLDQTSSPSATSHLLSSPSSASTRHHPRVQRGKEEDSSSMIPYIPESLLLHRRLLIATGDEILLLSVDRTPAYLSSSRQGGSNDADQHPSLLPSSSLPVFLQSLLLSSSSFSPSAQERGSPDCLFSPPLVSPTSWEVAWGLETCDARLASTAMTLRALAQEETILALHRAITSLSKSDPDGDKHRLSPVLSASQQQKRTEEAAEADRVREDKEEKTRNKKENDKGGGSTPPRDEGGSSDQQWRETKNKEEEEKKKTTAMMVLPNQGRRLQTDSSSLGLQERQSSALLEFLCSETFKKFFLQALVRHFSPQVFQSVIPPNVPLPVWMPSLWHCLVQISQQEKQIEAVLLSPSSSSVSSDSSLLPPSQRGKRSRRRRGGGTDGSSKRRGVDSPRETDEWREEEEEEEGGGDTAGRGREENKQTRTKSATGRSTPPPRSRLFFVKRMHLSTLPTQRRGQGERKGGGRGGGSGGGTVAWAKEQNEKKEKEEEEESLRGGRPAPGKHGFRNGDDENRRMTEISIDRGRLFDSQPSQGTPNSADLQPDPCTLLSRGKKGGERERKVLARRGEEREDLEEEATSPSGGISSSSPPLSHGPPHTSLTHRARDNTNGDGGAGGGGGRPPKLESLPRRQRHHPRQGSSSEAREGEEEEDLRWWQVGRVSGEDQRKEKRKTRRKKKTGKSASPLRGRTSSSSSSSPTVFDDAGVAPWLQGLSAKACLLFRGVGAWSLCVCNPSVRRKKGLKETL